MSGVIKTAKRVFEVLEYFGEVRRPLAVREIAAHCRYPLSSTAVLLKSMATLGYLAYDRASKAYFPTVRTAALGDWVLEALVVNSKILALADALYRQCGETVIVGVQNDVFVHYAHVLPGQRGPHFFTPVGSRRTLCLSGMGWAILCPQPDAAIQQLIVRTIARLRRTAQPITEEYVFEQVQHTRRQGYALSRGTLTRGVSIIAMPLRAPDILCGHMGIGVAGSSERIDQNVPRTVETIRRCIADAGLDCATTAPR
ncbi:MAG: helix-turn-helix domain-containing protein [Burkholderiaceae bacterium]|nr:helix-turn-helix domain-containing protein [Burkholderiaceae bacterium]